MPTPGQGSGASDDEAADELYAKYFPPASPPEVQVPTNDEYSRYFPHPTEGHR